MTPDLLYDQMVGIGRGAQARLLLRRQPRRRLAAPLPRRDRARLAARRSRSRSTATPGMANRYAAGAAGMPCAVMRGYVGTDLEARTRVERVTCPFTGEQLVAVPALQPDVAIVHAQEADRAGNVQLWGIPGVQKEAVLAAKRSLVTVERIVDELEPQAGRGRHPRLGDRRGRRGAAAARSRPTASASPSRDNDFYRAWDAISRDRDAFTAWMDGARAGEAASVSQTDRGEVQTVVAARRLATRVVLHRRRAVRARRRSSRAWSTTPTSCSSTSRGRSAPSRSTSRCRSATASWPRPPTRSSRCRRCSTTGSSPGRIDVAFLGAAQVDRYANLNSHRDRRLRASRRRACPAPAARPRSRPAAARSSSIAPHSHAHVRRASSTSYRGHGTVRARERLASAARTAAVITDLGVLEPDPRRRADADAAPPRRRPSTRCARRPAGTCASPTTSRRHRAADRRGADRAAGAGRAVSAAYVLRRGPHAVRPLRRRRWRACARTTWPRTSSRRCRARAGARPRARSTRCMFGDANQAGEDNRNVARMAVLLAGLPTSVPGDDGQPAVRLVAGRGDAGRAARSRPATRRASWSAASSR